MAHRTAFRVRETTTTEGTGNITVGGVPNASYRTFASVLTSNGDTCKYEIRHQTAHEWESGILTRVSSTEYSRTVDESSNGDAAVNFSAGTKHVFLVGKLGDDERECRVSGSDAASTSTSNADVAGMSMSVKANADYFFEFYGTYETAATTTGLKLAVTCPASPTSIRYETAIQISGAQGTDGWDTQAHVASDSTHTGASVDAANTARHFRVTGILRNGANAGNITLRLATEVAASAVTIHQGSYGRRRRLNF